MKAKPATELARRWKKVLKEPIKKLSGDASQSAYRNELGFVKFSTDQYVRCSWVRLTQTPRRLEATPMFESLT